MAKLFTGNQPFDDTINLRGMAPLDDREAYESLSDVYISASNKSASPLYNRAYKGMKITVFESDGTATVMSLKNSAPYSPDNTSINVTASNYETYWTVIGKATVDKITNTIDPSINKLEDYVRAVNIENGGGVGAINVTTASTTNGRTYDVSVNVDKDTIKIVDNKVTGGKYKITKMTEATSGMLASYKLSYKAPDATSYTDIEDSIIDIPKDYVVQEVHLCKASYADGTYTQTSTPNTTAWNTDTNPVYIHIIWQTKDPSAATSETYLKVADIIAADIVTINSSISALETRVYTVVDPSINKLESRAKALETSTNKIEDHIADTIDPSINTIENYIAKTIDPSVNKIETKISGTIDPSINTLESRASKHDTSVSALETRVYKVVDPSINKLETNLVTLTNTVNTNETNRKADDASIIKRIDAIDSSIANNDLYFNGGTESNTRAMLTDHGSLEGGTTIAQLEAMTISEILKKILFELATPTKRVDQSLTASWTSSSAYNSRMDVSCPLPSSGDITYTYTPEAWNWTSADGTVSGTQVNLSVESAHSYLRATSSTGTGSTSWSGNGTYGTNGYYYVTITYSGLHNAVDSLNSETNSSGAYYAQAKSGTIDSNRLTFTTGYRIYSNANVCVNTGSATVWNNRNTSPGSFVGNDTQTQSTFFADGTTAIYAQWPAALTSSQHMYIYVPTTQKITAVNSANANASNTWDWSGFTFTQVESSVTILNQYNYPATFNKWELTTESTGIKTVRITLATA